LDQWIFWALCANGVAALVMAAYLHFTWPEGGWSSHGWLILAGYGFGMLVLAFFAKRILLDD
jgi:hypothetical protein